MAKARFAALRLLGKCGKCVYPDMLGKRHLISNFELGKSERHSDKLLRLNAEPSVGCGRMKLETNMLAEI
jgi:hypothetical protein